MRVVVLLFVFTLLQSSCVSPARFDEMQKESQEISQKLKEASSEKEVWLADHHESKLIELRNDLADILLTIIQNQKPKIGDATEPDAEKNTLAAAEAILKLNSETYEFGDKDLINTHAALKAAYRGDIRGINHEQITHSHFYPYYNATLSCKCCNCEAKDCENNQDNRHCSHAAWNAWKIFCPVLWPYTIGELGITNLIDVAFNWDHVVAKRTLPPLDQKYVKLAEETKRDLQSPSPPGTAKTVTQNTLLELKYRLPAHGDQALIDLWRLLVEKDKLVVGELEKRFRPNLVFAEFWKEKLAKVKDLNDGQSHGAIKQWSIKLVSSKGEDGKDLFADITVRAHVFIPTSLRERFYLENRATQTDDGYDLSARAWEEETLLSESQGH